MIIAIYLPSRLSLRHKLLKTSNNIKYLVCSSGYDKLKVLFSINPIGLEMYDRDLKLKLIN